MRRVIVALALLALLALLGCPSAPLEGEEDVRRVEVMMEELRRRVAELEREVEHHAGELDEVAWERVEGVRP